LPIAFQAAKQISEGKGDDIESQTRKLAGKTFQKENVIPNMIEQIKTFCLPMTIAITRNVPDRFNGFINSCMHEIAPGVMLYPK
jgi:hypothetical protein